MIPTGLREEMIGQDSATIKDRSIGIMQCSTDVPSALFSHTISLK
jgi:hypothetical protein